MKGQVQMNYKLTVEEEAAIEHEVEMEREYLRMMGRSYTPIDLERILNKYECAREIELLINGGKRAANSLCSGSTHQRPRFSIANLIPQTYEILFPPENQTFEEYKRGWSKQTLNVTITFLWRRLRRL